MTTRRPLYVVALLAALLAIGACAPKSPDDSKVLASVNGEPITEKDYDDYLRARQQQNMPLPGDEAAKKKLILDEMISRTLLAQSAVAQKVDQEPDVYLQLKRQRENILARGALRKYFHDNPVPADEIQKRIVNDEFHTRHILVKSEPEAADIINQLSQGANFATLAKQKSIDLRSGKQGGDLGWISQEDPILPQFFTAVAAIKKGETSTQPLQTPFGWHVIKVDDVRPHKMHSLDQLKNDISIQIQQEQVDALVKSLRAKATIKTNE